MGLMTGYTEKPKEYFSRICEEDNAKLVAFEKRGDLCHAAVQQKGLTRYYYFSAYYSREDGWGYGNTWSEEHNTCDNMPSKVLNKLSPVAELYPALDMAKQCFIGAARHAAYQRNTRWLEKKVEKGDIIIFDEPLSYGDRLIDRFEIVDSKRRIAHPELNGEFDARLYRLPVGWRNQAPTIINAKEIEARVKAVMANA